MVFQDLREYLEELEKRGLLRRVRTSLSPDLEIPEALRQVMYSGGPAVLFENVKGYPGWRVAGNIFANIEYVKLALGVENLEDIGWRLVSLAWRQPPLTLTEKLRKLRDALEIGRYTPKLTRRAAFTRNVIEVNSISDIARVIPAFRQYPREPRPYLTYPLVIVKHPETGVTTMSVYRVMVRERDLVVHWQLHKRGQQAYNEWREKGAEEIPAAIVIGAEPATLLVGAFPVPYPMDKLLFAGIVRGEGIEVYRLDNGVEVPASAEVVIEGYVTNELADEGPFGDHWGYYDKPRRKFPIMRVTRIYIREEPVYYGTVVGKPVLEDAVIGKTVERIFLPIIKTLLPEVHDINFPPHGVFQGMVIVSIRKRYPGHAKKVMMALWGLGLLSLTKIIIVVDHDVNVHDINQVIWAVSSHVDPQRDVIVIPGTPTDELDPAVPVPGYGSKLGIDATRKLPEENMGVEWPEEVGVPDELVERIRKVLEKEGVVKDVKGSGAGL
nr:UbiD family decarboxylase [Pyrolobus fumarii]